MGLDWGAIKYRVEVAELHRLHAGVYAVGHRAISRRGQWMAAVLAGGEGAVLSHRHASELAGFRETIADEIDVTVQRHRGSRTGIVFHEALLHPADLAEIDGIPVTAVPRTLLDLASQLSVRQFEKAFWEAERLGLIASHDLRAFLARSHGRRGMGQLRRLSDRVLPPDLVVRSPLERRFYELCRDGDLPLPALNERVEGMEVDALWREQGLIVELDGQAYHRGVGAFERDRRRDARLQLAGYRVVRITHRRLESEPAVVLQELRRNIST